MPVSPSIASKLAGLDADRLATAMIKANKRATRQRRIAVTLFCAVVALVSASIWTSYHVQFALTAVLVLVLALVKVVNTVMFLAMAGACRQALATRGETNA